MCGGDSGGPAVVDGILVGVNGSVYGQRKGVCGTGEESSHSSVWHALPWITANMNVLLRSSQNSDFLKPNDPQTPGQSIENPNAIYVDNAPSNACSKVAGIFDALPAVVRRDTGEPGLVCSDGNPQSPDVIIKCTSSVDPNSCSKTGFCYVDGKLTNSCGSIF